jgi:hypothetical protein
MKRLRIFAWLWVTVLFGTGLAGGIVVSRVGWALAMGAAIYGGNPEPSHPVLPFPWRIFGIAVALALGGLGLGMIQRRRRGSTAAPSGLVTLLPLGLAYVGGLLATLIPFVQIYRLWSLTG